MRSRGPRVAYMLTGGGPGGLSGHLFDSLEEAERWLSNRFVAESYGLNEVSISPKYCACCKRPKPKLLRRVHEIGGMAKKGKGNG